MYYRYEGFLNGIRKTRRRRCKIGTQYTRFIIKGKVKGIMVMTDLNTKVKVGI